MTTKVIKSNDVWDDILRALKMERDVDEPMLSMTITLENDMPVIVTQTKYASDNKG